MFFQIPCHHPQGPLRPKKTRRLVGTVSGPRLMTVLWASWLNGRRG